MRVKIETVSALEVTTKTPNSFETRAPSTSLCPAGPLSAAVMVPFESKVRINGVGLFGFQFSWAIGPVEINETYVEPAVKADPVEGKR
jgi:hypothetical protein